VNAPRPDRRDYLIDVSRLVWRAATKRLPTGIDRVCLAYVEHYGHQGLAVIQRSGHHVVLNGRRSDELFRLLTSRSPPSRVTLTKSLALAAVGMRTGPPRSGMIYLNVGHTGLNEPSLTGWIKRAGTRAVYMVHDLIPLTHPQFCRPGEALKHAQRIDHVLESATGIIGNSEATLEEVRHYAREKGFAMPAAVAAWLSGPAPKAGAVASRLEEPYFVMLGTIEGRKNHRLILDLWAQMIAERGQRAPALVIIGQRGWEADAALARLDRLQAFEGRVLHFDKCDDGERATWLAGATALLMPSFAEGFGLPVVESLQLGTPVIASDLPVFREIAGSIPTYLSARDAAGWKAAIASFAVYGPERKRQLAAMKGFTVPTWSRHFATVDAWLATLSTQSAEKMTQAARQI
jgi:hypothetical protein